MEIKWETLKKRAFNAAYRMNALHFDACATALIAGIADGSHWRDNLTEMQEQIDNIVMRWDIRQAMKLVTAFPSILPVKYHQQIPLIQYDESGSWVLYF